MQRICRHLRQPLQSWGKVWSFRVRFRLSGRPFTGLILGDLGLNPHSNNPLIQGLNRIQAARKKSASAGTATTPEEQCPPPPDNEPQLARIYGFSYLGNYFKLPEPLVFLVYGPGTQVPSGFRLPEVDTSTIGLDFKNQAPTWGIVMWTADQLDISVRIDVSIGWLKDLLLEVEMTSETNVTGGPVAPSRSRRAGRPGGTGGSGGARRSGWTGRHDHGRPAATLMYQAPSLTDAGRGDVVHGNMPLDSAIPVRG